MRARVVYAREPEAQPARYALVARGTNAVFDAGLLPGDVLATLDDGTTLVLRAIDGTLPRRFIESLQRSNALRPLHHG